MVKYVLLAIGALLSITVVMTSIQYFVMNFLKKQEEEPEERF